MRSLSVRVERQRLGAAGAAGTLLLHASVAAAVLLPSGRAPGRRLPAYRVELVAAPAAAAPASAAAAPPAPAPPVERPRPAAPPIGTPAPARAAPARAQRDARKSEEPPAAAPIRAPEPVAAEGAPGGAGADAATIRTEGVEFPFPGYLRNLVAQVYRRWRPPDDDSGLEAEIFFLVQRDGSISGLRFLRRSGAFAFDLEAQGAVEAAARAGAFGSLPPGYGADVLPVSFFFSPRSLR